MLVFSALFLYHRSLNSHLPLLPAPLPWAFRMLRKPIPAPWRTSQVGSNKSIQRCSQTIVNGHSIGLCCSVASADGGGFLDSTTNLLDCGCAVNSNSRRNSSEKLTNSISMSRTIFILFNFDRRRGRFALEIYYSYSKTITSISTCRTGIDNNNADPTCPCFCSSWRHFSFCV